MPRGRYEQIKWLERQQAILDMLEQLSLERGFAAVTMDDVAAGVGIAKKTLYQHFKSKEAMLEQLLLQREDEFIAWLAGTVTEPPLERLRATMRYLMEGHVTPLRGLVSLGYEDVRPIFEHSPALVERHAQIMAQLTEIIQVGQQQGQLTSEVTPGAMIGAMIALSQVQYTFPQAQGYGEQMISLFERAVRSGKEK